MNTQFPALPIPSSILPSLSGIGEINNPYISGYPDVSTKKGLLQLGSGLFTGNFLDYHQDRDFVMIDNILGEQLEKENGINKYYPSPASYNTSHSGLYFTKPPNSGGNPEWFSYDGSRGSGIFSFAALFSRFSNAPESKNRAGASGINDFTIFNPYVHFYASNLTPVFIPYLSDLYPAVNMWDRYRYG